MSTPRIKDCACGSDFITRRQYFPSRAYEIICESCGVCVEGIDKADAVKEWNRRAAQESKTKVELPEEFGEVEELLVHQKNKEPK